MTLKIQEYSGAMPTNRRGRGYSNATRELLPVLVNAALSGKPQRWVGAAEDTEMYRRNQANVRRIAKSQGMRASVVAMEHDILFQITVEDATAFESAKALVEAAAPKTAPPTPTKVAKKAAAKR